MEYEATYEFDPGMYEAGTHAGVAVFAGVMMFALIISLAFYVYIAIALMRIAKKTGISNGWFAWVPILNVILMLQIAKKPMWWLLMFFIPGVNIVFTILVWMEIAKAVGKPEWWGILMIVPVANLIVPGYLAFSDNGVIDTQPVVNTPEPQPATSQPPVEPKDQNKPKDDKGGNLPIDMD